MFAQTVPIGINVNSPVTWFVIIVVAIVLALTLSTRRNAARARPVVMTARVEPSGWPAVESLFVDDPRAGLAAAQSLVARVRMTRPQAPPEDKRYADACAVAVNERATTEEMREALLAFRALFNAR